MQYVCEYYAAAGECWRNQYEKYFVLWWSILSLGQFHQYTELAHLGNRKYPYNYPWIPKVMVWAVISSKGFIGPFFCLQTITAAFCLQFSVNLWLSKMPWRILRTLCGYPSTSNGWSLSFSQRPFWWSCHCSGLFKAFGKQHGLDYLCFRFDSLWFFSVFL